MTTARVAFAALASLLVGCGGSDTSPPLDATWVSPDADTGDDDGDGLINALDPTPTGSDANQLKGTFTGGQASVVSIVGLDGTGAEDAELPYQTDLTANCDQNWYPQGLLCDDPRPDPVDRDSPTVSANNPSTGATWRNLDLLTTGVLVIDACAQGGCAAIDFNEARVFQMFSDGKTTQVRLYAHASMATTPPPWNDPGWTLLVEGAVGAGTNTDGVSAVVTDPTVLPLSQTALTRYLRVDAKNDGSLGSPGYVEVRSLKLFGAPAI